MGGTSRDVKRLKKWDFYPLYFGFSWPLIFFLLCLKLPCVLSICRRVILCHVVAATKAQLSDFQLGKKLFQFLSYAILKMVNKKFKKVGIWLLSECKDFCIIFFAYYDSLLPIGSDEIIKRPNIWLNNPQCGHKEGQKFPIFVEITIKANPPIYEIHLI